MLIEGSGLVKWVFTRSVSGRVGFFCLGLYGVAFHFFELCCLIKIQLSIGLLGRLARGGRDTAIRRMATMGILVVR